VDKMAKKTKIKIEVNNPKFKYECEGKEDEVLDLAIKALNDLKDAYRSAGTQ